VPARAIKFADFVLKIVAACFVLMLVYLGVQYRFSTSGVPVIFYVIPVTGIVTIVALLRTRPLFRINAAATIVAVGLALYAFELFVEWRFPANPLQVAAQRAGKPYDGRSTLEVVQDLRRDGFRAYPPAFPNLYIGAHQGRNDLTPLGGIADTRTVFCNESGPYMIYDSDEHGFNNPKGIWAEEGLEIAVVGDSFTQGFCVPQGQDMVSRIREAWPRTLNLGMSGNGPLMQLATIREYLPALKPAVVLWNYFEGNDLFDLEQEKSVPVLKKYMDASFRQGLASKQAEVDTLLASWMENVIKAGATSSQDELFRKSTRVDAIKHFVTLKGLRDLLQLTASPGQQYRECDVAFLQDVLKQANTTVASWGGRLVFVYLPNWTRYHRGLNPCERLDDEILVRVRALGIPVVDVHEAFQRHPNPSKLFAQEELGYSHYGADGYRLAAQTVIESVRSANLLLPSDSSKPVYVAGPQP
jgi:hypothetical protein